MREPKVTVVPWNSETGGHKEVGAKATLANGVAICVEGLDENDNYVLAFETALRADGMLWGEPTVLLSQRALETMNDRIAELETSDGNT